MSRLGDQATEALDMPASRWGNIFRSANADGGGSGKGGGKEFDSRLGMNRSELLRCVTVCISMGWHGQ